MADRHKIDNTSVTALSGAHLMPETRNHPAILIAAVSAIAASACSDITSNDLLPKSNTCATQMIDKRVDEQCALEIAKQEIRRREGRIAYSEFKANYDKQTEQWVIRAGIERDLPGAFLIVFVTRGGQISNYQYGE